MSSKAQFPDEKNASGQFVRQADAFREWISSDGSTPYPAAKGRYHLYISLACPWASRTFIVRKLKGLERAIGVTVVDPIRDERGWAFRKGPGHSLDPVNGFSFLSEAYTATHPQYRGRVTVPVLWDKQTRRIVSNSEDDICRMFNNAFGAFSEKKVDLFPPEIEAEHRQLAAFVYENINPFHSFNPRARAGRDFLSRTLKNPAESFNPRARAGRDLARCALSSAIPAFQSTRPRGARRDTLVT